MAGENDRIHSYNPVYRTGVVAQQFNSFGRPNGEFINQPVSIVGGQLGVYDHQGHIVPQNILNQVLNATMTDMFNTCGTIQEVLDYIRNGPQWLQDAFAYGDQLGLDMIDMGGKYPEDRFGTLFSIITWNPVNLCRAPSDDRRGGYPGNHIDVQVANYLNANQAQQGVDANWLQALNNLIANTTIGTINAYLDACSATLNGQLTNGIGYYQFQWEYADQEDAFLQASPDLHLTGGKVLLPAKK